MGGTVPRLPVSTPAIFTPALKASIIVGFQHREKNPIRLLYPTQMIERGQSEVREVAGSTAILIDLKTVVTVRAPAGAMATCHIILIGDGNKIAGQTQSKMRVANRFHFGEKAIQYRISLVMGYQPVGNGDAVDPEKIIIMQLAIRTAPAGKNTGSRVVKGLEIRRFQFFRGNAIAALAGGVV